MTNKPSPAKASSISEIPLEEDYQNLLQEAQLSAGDDETYDEGRKIDWLDMDLAQAGQMFVRKYRIPIGASHMVYLLLVLNIKTIATVLLKTGRFSGIQSAVGRFVQTVAHILCWYEEDIIGVYASGFKDVGTVRATHAAIRRKCNEEKDDLIFDEDEEDCAERTHLSAAMDADLHFLDTSILENLNLSYNPSLFMSQFDMIMTQLIFFIPVYIQPWAFGITDIEGIEGFEHLWALLGRLCGIHDRFNILIRKPGKEFYMKFWKEVMIPAFMESDIKRFTLLNTFVTACRKVMPMPSLKTCLYYCLSETPLEMYDGKELYKVMGYGDRLVVFLLKILVKVIGSSKLIMWFVNWSSGLYLNFLTGRLGFAKPKTKFKKPIRMTKLAGNIKWSEKYRERDGEKVDKWRKIKRYNSWLNESNESTN